MQIDDRPDFAQRLEQARIKRGFKTIMDATKFFGWSYPTYAQHESGIRGIGRAAGKYAKAYRVSEGWLLTGEGVGPEGDTTSTLVPLVAWVSAGQMARDDFTDEALGVIAVTDLPAGDWIALKVHGDSMDRISPPDSVIFVDRNDKRLVPNGLYVIDDGEGNATYKRYRPGPPPRFEPVSVNAGIEPIFFENEPLVIGRVRRSMIDT